MKLSISLLALTLLSSASASRLVVTSHSAIATNRKRRFGIRLKRPNATRVVDTTNRQTIAVPAPTEQPEVLDSDALKKKKAEVVQNSVVSGLSCLSTFAMMQYGLPPARASGLQGMIACALGSPAFAAASLSGAFTGMSLHLTNWVQASMLSCVTAVMYFVFERGDRLLVGRGGRLGTISVLASMSYFALRVDESFVNTLVKIWETLGSHNVLRLAVASSVLALSRTSYVSERKRIPRGFLVWASKLAIAGIVLSCAKDFKILVDPLFTWPAMILAGLVTRYSPGKVLPMAIVDFIASYCGFLTNPICIGGLIGMTRMPQFSLFSLFQSTMIASMLLGLNVLDGIGGRLGIFTILGVSLVAFQYKDEETKEHAA